MSMDESTNTHSTARDEVNHTTNTKPPPMITVQKSTTNMVPSDIHIIHQDSNTHSTVRDEVNHTANTRPPPMITVQKSTTSMVPSDIHISHLDSSVEIQPRNWT